MNRLDDPIVVCADCRTLIHIEEAIKFEDDDKEALCSECLARHIEGAARNQRANKRPHKVPMTGPPIRHS